MGHLSFCYTLQVKFVTSKKWLSWGHLFSLWHQGFGSSEWLRWVLLMPHGVRNFVTPFLWYFKSFLTTKFSVLEAYSLHNCLEFLTMKGQAYPWKFLRDYVGNNDQVQEFSLWKSRCFGHNHINTFPKTFVMLSYHLGICQNTLEEIKLSLLQQKHTYFCVNHYFSSMNVIKPHRLQDTF
jgi:hypothetical protein